jgi:3-dehydroquinate synthase
VVTISAGPYEVLVGRGALASLGELVRKACPAHQYAVIADQHVADLYGAAALSSLSGAGLSARLFPFPSGEWNKTREQWGALTDQLLAARIGRDGAVVALGGGVAGDLGGFVAATYLRGIPCVQVPTTLLAMIDAAIGGKTGLDVPAGKNLVGAFHPPRAVLADVDLLATLPRPQLASGLAEAVKHGVIADAGYLRIFETPAALLAREPAALEPLVVRSIEIKAGIVAQDARETGLRQVLNFGHTVAHALEAHSGYALLHGEAVAIGMVAEAWIAEACGLAGRGLHDAVAGILEGCALPTTIPADLTTDALLEVMQADKKVRAGTVRFALPSRLGAMARAPDGAWTIEVDARLTRQALDTIR